MAEAHSEDEEEEFLVVGVEQAVGETQEEAGTVDSSSTISPSQAFQHYTGPLELLPAK